MMTVLLLVILLLVLLNERAYKTCQRLAWVGGKLFVKYCVPPPAEKHDDDDDDDHSEKGKGYCAKRVTDKTKRRIGAKQHWKCAYCDVTLDETYQIDHIRPRAELGNNDESNLQALCVECHRNKTVAENRMRGKRRRRAKH